MATGSISTEHPHLDWDGYSVSRFAFRWYSVFRNAQRLYQNSGCSRSASCAHRHYKSTRKMPESLPHRSGPFRFDHRTLPLFLGETNRRHKHRESAHATGSPVRETPWKRRVNSASGQRIRGAYDSTWKVGWSTSVLFASSPEIQGPLQEPEAAALRGLQCLQRSSGPEAMDPE